MYRPIFVNDEMLFFKGKQKSNLQSNCKSQSTHDEIRNAIC